MEYRKDIQGLRALAVIFVLVFHINPLWLPGGYIGVDVFFVISGFLVSSIILKKAGAKTFSFAGFYMGRLKRIVPAYYFVLLCVAVAGALLLIGSDVATLTGKVGHAMVFDTDRVYMKGESYFGMNLQQDPLLHTWTIAVEMKFYLLLPILLFLVKRKYLVYVLAGISALLLLYATYMLEIAHSATAAYYSVFTRIPEFFSGVLLALAPKNIIKAKLAAFAGFTGLCLLAVCAFLFSHKTHFPGIAALLPCLGAVLLIGAANSPVNRVLALRPFEFTGMLSYAIYLWHWPIIALMRYYYARDVFTPGQVVFIVLLTFSCSWASYTFIENFFRKKRALVFWYGVLPLGLVLAGLYAFMPKINQMATPIPVEYVSPSFGLPSHNTTHVQALGDTAAPSRIVLIGNSHALCTKAYLDYLGNEGHFSFRTLTCDSFPAIEGISEADAIEIGRHADYLQSLPLIPVTQKEIERATIIILVMSDWIMVPSLTQAIQNLAAHLKNTQQLVLLTPFPVLDKNPILINRSIVKDKSRPQAYRVFGHDFFPAYKRLAEQYANVHLLSLQESTAFKNAPFYNDTIMYFDGAHLNRFGAKVLAKHTKKQFMDFLNALPK